MFGHGRTLKDARIASDIGEMWIEAVRGAEAIGSFTPLTHGELFELEYWSLEQAKLAANKPKPLTGQVALITGGAGAIGAATAKLFAANGAHAVVVDLDAEKAAAVAQEPAGNDSIDIGCDITDPRPCAPHSTARSRHYGGLDILVSNAGAAFEGAIGEIDDACCARVSNSTSSPIRMPRQNAVRIFKEQGTGGELLFNTSKQAVNPGAEIRRLRLCPKPPRSSSPASTPWSTARRSIRVQRRQRRPHPLGPPDPRDDRQPQQGPQSLGEGLHVRQLAGPGSDRGARGAGVFASCAGGADDGGRDDGGWMAYCGGVEVGGATTTVTSPSLS